MADEKKLMEGVRIFDKHENAPDFVICSLVFTPEEMIAFFKANKDLMTEYNGKKQLRVQMLRSQKGNMYLQVDTYKKADGATTKVKAPVVTPVDDLEDTDDLPF